MRTVAVLEIYKRGQGRYARTITFVAAMVIALGGAVALSRKLEGYAPPVFQFGLPALLLVVAGLFMFWMVNRAKSADFLIATEGEMKKVSWSSRKEIVGSTKVVIVATFIMAGILYAVDAGFALLFTVMGVMGG
jgi:preprotein translocase subunit SecE